MTVYVDDAVWKWRGKVWAHMTADTHDELHAFAKRLGLKRGWFQDKDHHQHYDVTAQKRVEALAMGAVYVPMRLYADLYKTLPIAGEWMKIALEAEADFAVLPEDEARESALARYYEWKADRALRVEPKKGRRR